MMVVKILMEYRKRVVAQVKGVMVMMMARSFWL